MCDKNVWFFLNTESLKIALKSLETRPQSFVYIFFKPTALGFGREPRTGDKISFSA